MKSGSKLLIVAVIVSLSVLANAGIYMTVDGSNAAIQPFNASTSGEITFGLAGSAQIQQNKYDLTIVADGGTLQDLDASGQNAVPSNELNFRISDLSSVDNIKFVFNEGVNATRVALITNDDIVVDGIDATAGTTIYEMILFNLLDVGQIVVFGMDYPALIAASQPPEETQAAAPLTAPMAMGESSSQQMMTTMSSEPPEPVWFDDPALCPDLDNDDFVNFNDFTILSGNWLADGNDLAGDFDADGSVDANDLMHFVTYWLTPVDCPEYYADELPYMTSFESYQGFETDPNNPYSLDYQMGWQVSEGEAVIDYWWAYVSELNDYYDYQYVVSDPNTVIEKDFTGTGNNNYVQLSFIPAIDQKINIVDSNSIAASVWFNSDGYIYVLDNGTYANTNVSYATVYNDCWWYYSNSYDYGNTWTSLKFKINWSSDTYEVYWDGNDTTDIASLADFDQNYDEVTSVKIENTVDWYALNSLSISNWSTGGPDVEIVTPCACDTDTDLKGRVPIIGTAKGDNFGKYDIYVCPSDLDTSDLYNWVKIAEGSNLVNHDVLGYWDTSSFPNGYYHMAVVVFNDLGYPEGVPSNWFKVITKELYIGGTKVYEGLGYFPVVGDLKANTFHYTEEPDISVPWAGQFPFELRRSYNNNRRFYRKPLYNGWTHNNQITLTEDCRYNWESVDSGPFLVPAWDDNMLGIGYIWVKYPDGSKRLFRDTSGNYDYSTVTYTPWPDDNTGDYIERQSYEDFLTVTEIYYTLYTRDGKELDFSITGLNIPWGGSYGSTGWEVEVGINSMTDRFGNSLNYSWRYRNGSPVAVTNVSNGNLQIAFTLNGSDEYTKAELKDGSTVLRTVKFDRDDDPNVLDYAFTVTKVGKGANEQGVYDSSNNKEYVTKYLYDSGMNLRKIININGSSQDESLIEVDYDAYGRVETRRDYIESDNYQETMYGYTFTKVSSGKYNLETIVATDEKASLALQNEDGALLWRETLTSDGSAVVDANSFYNDSSNPLKATDVYEYFDGQVRRAWSDYNYYGDLVEQRIYVDDSNYVATEIEYHPDYALETSKTSWQDLNKTGQKVQKVSVYGDADGSVNINGDYLVAEKVLLYDSGSGDPNEDQWAVTSYTYYDTDSKKGLVHTIIDPENNIAIYDYDDNGYLSMLTKGADPNSFGPGDPNDIGPVERYYHDAIGQKILKANSFGGVVLNDYDEFGRLYKIRLYEDLSVMSLSSQNFVPSRYEQMTPESTVKYGYDEQDNRTFEKKTTGGEIGTTYTLNGSPKTITYGDNSYTEYDYDERGNKTQEYRYEATGTVDWYITFDYDSMDRLVETMWLDYDDLTIVKRQNSEYYGTGHKKYDYHYGYGDVLEKQVDYNYDILGRMTSSVISPGGLNITTSFAYDAAGNRTSVTDPDGNITWYGYDNANRKTEKYFAAAGGTVKSEATINKELGYYNNNKIKSQTSYDYDGETILAYSEFEYDGRGRITKTAQLIDPNVAETWYDYYDAYADPNDPNTTGQEVQICVTDSENKETWITMDAFGRRVKTEYPSDDYEEVAYNSDGTLYGKAVWNSTGTKQWITYDSDDYGRVEDVNYPDTGTISYTYDGFGRKLLVDDNRNSTDNIGGTGQISYEYDVLDRIAKFTEQDGYVVSYDYRHDGQKQSVQVEEPGTPMTVVYDVDYTFDAANRVMNVYDGLEVDPLSNWIAQFGYDNNGNRDTLTYYLTGSAIGSKVEMDYSYNKDNYLTSYTTTGGPTFTFDAMQTGDIDGLGRLTSAEETIDSSSHSLDYSYDGLGQMETVSITNINSATWIADYTYHKDGNLDTRTEAGTVTNHSYTGDLLTTVGANTLAWDDNGNMKTGVGVSIIWNADNRIQSATVGSDSIGCVYDHAGRMISKSSTISGSSSTEKYILDIVGKYPMILVVIDPDDSSIDKTYVHSGGQTLMQQAGANKYYYLHDRLGSVRQVVNSSASVVNSYTYDPWGNQFSSETSETIDNHYQFANYHWDSTAGMFYLNARWYDPLVLRFTGRDPVNGKFNEPLMLHRYLYCANDPINGTDPTGEFLGLIGGQGLMGRMRLSSAAFGAKAMAFAGRIYAAAYVRAVGINIFLYNAMYGGDNNLTSASRWGRAGLQQGDWIMKGTNSWVNYILSGKWQPGMGNQFAPYGSGQAFLVNAKDLMWPTGWEWIKGFLGQRIYNP